MLEPASVTEKLTKGLEVLTAKFPWIAGQVISTSAADGIVDGAAIVPLRTLPALIAKDMTQDGSTISFEALKGAGYPFALLDELIICPRTTLSQRSGETSSDPYPVLLLQANFIREGLLLVIQACHSAMDIIGQVQIIQLLSMACNGQGFTDQQVTEGNLERRQLIPLLMQTDEAGTPPAQNPKTQLPLEAKQYDTPPDYQWSYFEFDEANLSRLKTVAAEDLPPDCTFISTDDAICSILWQAIGRARLARLSLTATTTFVRQVDMRSHMGLSSAFTGNMVVSTKTDMSLRDLVHTSLSAVAARLRSELKPPALKHTLQLNATSAANPRNLSSEPSKDRSQLIVMSSWTKANCYDVDFGLGLGKPDCVRRPRFSPTEGVVYLLPKSPRGIIAAGLCLRTDDMTSMKTDKQLLDYARYIG